MVVLLISSMSGCRLTRTLETEIKKTGQKLERVTEKSEKVGTALEKTADSMTKDAEARKELTEAVTQELIPQVKQTLTTVNKILGWIDILLYTTIISLLGTTFTVGKSIRRKMRERAQQKQGLLSNAGS